MSDKTILAVGQLSLAGRVIENPTEMEIGVDIEEITLKNSGSVGGGNYRSKKRITGINFTAKIHDFSGASIADLLSGTYAEVAAGAVAAEAMITREGLLVTTDNVIDTDETVTVTKNPDTHAVSTAFALNDYIEEGTTLYRVKTAGTTAGTKPTFTEDGNDVTDGTVTWEDMGTFAAVKDTDFIVSAAGIRTVSGAGIPDYCPVNVAYTKHLADKVQLADGVKTDIEVTFDGWNEDDDTPVVAQFFKVSLSADGGLPLISDGYGEVTISGTVNKDTSKPASASQFGTLVVGKTSVV